MRKRITNMDTTKAVTNPIPKTDHSRVDQIKPAFINFKKLAPNITGMAKKNENSAATVRLKPNHMAPQMVAPLRDVPGIKASIWNKPMIKASLYVIFNKLFLG